MIKVENGETTIEGNLIDTLSDLSCIVHAIKKTITNKGFSDETAKKDIMEAVDLGLKSDEEIYEEIRKEKMEIERIFFGEIISDFLKGFGE